ncbi:MAG TPA: hypothetical protein PKX05_05620, partial [bacterium]|nr:hypothetical protein [bacterium]
METCFFLIKYRLRKIGIRRWPAKKLGLPNVEIGYLVVWYCTKAVIEATTIDAAHINASVISHFQSIPTIKR